MSGRTADAHPPSDGPDLSETATAVPPLLVSRCVRNTAPLDRAKLEETWSMDRRERRAVDQDPGSRAQNIGPITAFL